tara:strand:+ start:3009 stop:4904 length:1896 start_codon:yes stop_codon:yes gene_type:complete
MPIWKICGADTETKQGLIWLYSTEEGVWEIESFYQLVMLHYIKKHSKSWKKSRKSASKKGVLRGISPKEFFFWNLRFDAQAVIKLLPDSYISELLDEGKIRFNAKSLDNNEVEGEMITIRYLEGKMFSMKPEKWFYGRYQLGEIIWWDISQFYYKVRLNTAAKTYLQKEKLEECFDGSILDASRFDDNDYTEFYKEDIDKYALIDAQLAGELARLTHSDFTSRNVRFIKPYSLANVAQRALFDMCKIPTINEMYNDEDYNRILSYAWQSYKGGWFETSGSGHFKNNHLLDIVSAYPYIMYWLPDITKGTWVEGDIQEEWLEFLESRTAYTPGFCEIHIEFKPGQTWYPLCVKSSSGTLCSPRVVSGWFTADEIEEALKHPYETVIFGRWTYFHSTELEYPFRKFIDRFYKMKMEATNDPIAYRVAKVCINSIYGKTVQNVDGIIGKMWNPIFASMITGATRARLSELNRLNGNQAVSYATDGVILPKTDKPIVIPPRPLEAPYNLGEWEIEGEGNVLILMSGVYTVNSHKIKTTYRGSASYFIRDYSEKGLYDFCKENRSLGKLSKHIIKPYSAREARMKSDFGLMNVFEERTFSISVMGDSNKRNWINMPATFGDLLNNTFTSIPHERLH